MKVMYRPLQRLKYAAQEPCTVLLDEANIAWVRTGELTLGYVVAGDGVRAWDAAYRKLDDLAVLKPGETWNVHLVVECPAGTPPARLREVEADLMGSRKLAVVGDAALLNLSLRSTIASDDAVPSPVVTEDLIARTLDGIAQGELRQTLDVLLRPRREPPEQVDRLIHLLGRADDATGK